MRNTRRIIEWRRRTKRRAVEYLGGKCQLCGYCKSIAALTFHHRNRAEKNFKIGSGVTQSWDKIKKELDKCDLLCFNCHMELEEKLFWGVPQSVQGVAVTHVFAGSSPAAPAISEPR